MKSVQEAFERLSTLPEIAVRRDVPLSGYTRFGIGGPADLLVETRSREAFIEALRAVRSLGLKVAIIGCGTNLIVSDEGFRGAVLRFTGDAIECNGSCVSFEAGAFLQGLVDFTIARGLKGLETMTGIPGSAGAAVYGNAGAYGHSISGRVSNVVFFDGERIRSIGNAECDFRYRESVFKQRPDWIIFSADLRMDPDDGAAMAENAARILAIRNKKYPPTMKCAGSIFKNLLLADLSEQVKADLPPDAIIEGKVPSAWFLERVGAKGMRAGDIQVADYHANLIYNHGHGSARELVRLISELKERVRNRWNLPLEEEVRYVGFD
jgi:UDP-N-acetylmuramate dehydrogenase